MKQIKTAVLLTFLAIGFNANAAIFNVELTGVINTVGAPTPAIGLNDPFSISFTINDFAATRSDTGDFRSDYNNVIFGMSGTIGTMMFNSAATQTFDPSVVINDNAFGNVDGFELIHNVVTDTALAGSTDAILRIDLNELLGVMFDDTELTADKFSASALAAASNTQLLRFRFPVAQAIFEGHIETMSSTVARPVSVRGAFLFFAISLAGLVMRRSRIERNL